ncbi:tRNA 2-thiouridine synthesizing protein E; Dissimilatory sulfite reductase, gamma subunit [Thioalkalivibrio nitratireducens DSM 14787]|uniref:Sulfurtransferase n=1 Tax=Thioalkalivibrio nitratireducens (strain DSM 14787 / UNIQEM 213 / ALEN2) TaxID=1255043 RepID=L0DU79_THIND|nr:TusE/DsrC/DsvC family sulfur relay protein [Thioalkalivibrio nitratireducens]AGA32555.1 tRNA 2-thiouridine synthesizing protein E; Dissimilatory sulfite reductase, gamma subunit [Thioalkalivibrio nitratireducens DSM 14787]
MSLEVDGNTIATNANGYLEELSDWSEKVAEAIAAKEGITLTQRHWDLIRYLRDEYVNNGENQPNTRTIVKAMQQLWSDKSVDAKTVYDLFPLDPSKQGGRIAGLPESRRKGGY